MSTPDNMATITRNLFCLFSIIHVTVGGTMTAAPGYSLGVTVETTPAVRWHHRFRMNQNSTTRINNVSLTELSILRLMTRKYAKEAKLSKDATKKLQKIFESHPPRIGSKDEDRSEWTEQQWKQEELEARLHRKRVRNIAYETISEHKELNTFFRKLETHEETIKREVEHQIKEDLHRIAKRNHLNDTEFEKFMAIREANKPKIHWRLNMHPNEVKKADAAMERSWKRTKLESLERVTPEQKPYMDVFLKDVEETSQRRHNRQHQNNRVKQFLGKFFYRRHPAHTSLIMDS